MKDDAVIKDNEAVYLINDQTYLHLRENLAGVGYEVFDKNSPLPVEEGQIPREVLGNTQRRIETARAYYLAEHQDEPVGRIEEMQERVDAATAHYHELGDSIKASEKRLAEIAVLKAHIINYAKTRPVYDAYRKSGYSKKFLEAHREQITLHKAAKAAFDEASLKKLPKVKELDAEYATLLSQKKAAYPAYRKARDEMQELKKAQKNVELFFAEEKDPKEKSQTR